MAKSFKQNQQLIQMDNKHLLYKIKKIKINLLYKKSIIKGVEMFDYSVIDLETIGNNTLEDIFYTTLPIAICVIKNDNKPKFSSVVYLLNKFLTQSIDYGFIKIVEEEDKGLFHIFFQFRSYKTYQNLLYLYNLSVLEGGIYSREICPHLIMAKNFISILTQNKGFDISKDKQVRNKAIKDLLGFLEHNNYFNCVPPKYRYNPHGNINYTYHNFYKDVSKLNINTTLDLEIKTTNTNTIYLVEQGNRLAKDLKLKNSIKKQTEVIYNHDKEEDVEARLKQFGYSDDLDDNKKLKDAKEDLKLNKNNDKQIQQINKDIDKKN